MVNDLWEKGFINTDRIAKPRVRIAVERKQLSRLNDKLAKQVQKRESSEQLKRSLELINQYLQSVDPNTGILLGHVLDIFSFIQWNWKFSCMYEAVDLEREFQYQKEVLWNVRKLDSDLER